MGRKIEALKWAMRTKPNFRISDKEEWARHEIGYLFMPRRCDTSYVIYGTIGALFLLFVSSFLYNLPDLLSLAMFALIGYIGYRAAAKLGNDWTDENLEITIKRKHESQVKE